MQDSESVQPTGERNRSSERFLFAAPQEHPKILIDPRIPDLLVSDFCGIPFARLAQAGIVNYCLDLDNTLALQTGHEPAPGVLDTLTWARGRGWIQKVCLISNTLWGGHRRRRLLDLARQLGIEDAFGCRLWERKPRSVSFRWALNRMGVEPETTAMVGDQIYSDIVGGNRMGLYTILLPQLGPDHWTTAITGRRFREFLVLRRYGLVFPKGPRPEERTGPA